MGAITYAPLNDFSMQVTYTLEAIMLTFQRKKAYSTSYMRIHYREKYWIWMINKKKITPPYA